MWNLIFGVFVLALSARFAYASVSTDDPTAWVAAAILFVSGVFHVVLFSRR